ncbi:MAG TPA: hypothetical protein PK867_02665 [Pirellulales bacterium]|nr:hypothetical protein [Pirellulales bacterium]
MAMFLQFGWEARRFRYLHCQAIAVIGGTLDDAYLRSDGIDLRYLRLEYESGPFMLGALFSHPVVHIHSQPREAPRFALDSTDGETVLLDFLDFLYRNFCHDAWSRWATVACEASADPETAVHFEAIRTFFLEEEGPGKRARLAEVIARCRDWLPRVKRCLRAAKKEMPMNLTVEPGDLTLFSYHL